MRYQIPGHGQSPTDWQCRMPYLVHLRVWRVSRCGQLVDRHVRAVVTVGGAQLDWRVPQHRPSERACVGRLRRPHPGAGPPLFAHGEGTALSGVPRRRISVQVTAWSGRRPLRSRRSRRAERVWSSPVPALDRVREPGPDSRAACVQAGPILHTCRHRSHRRYVRRGQGRRPHRQERPSRPHPLHRLALLRNSHTQANRPQLTGHSGDADFVCGRGTESPSVHGRSER